MTTCELIAMTTRSPAPEPRAFSDNSADRNIGAALRRQLWSAVVRKLNNSKLPYCLLGAADDAPERSESDMDFVVPPDDYSAVPHLLASAAASVGGRLIQAIDHETTATYFALAKQQGAVVAFLHPDCTTNYRRQRRLWMSAEELLRGRRRASGGYFRPAPDVEFKYYLIKQVLKQTLSDAQWRKLTALHQAATDPREAVRRWRLVTAAQIEQSLLHNDHEAFRSLAPQLRRELTGTPSLERTLARAVSCTANVARILSRMARPTGLFVQINAGSPEERTELAEKLAKNLAPAFRRSLVDRCGNPAKVLRALVASTLVVSPDSVPPRRTLYGGIDISWQPSLTSCENFEYAVASVLSHLAHRTARRLELQNHEPLELRELARTTAF